MKLLTLTEFIKKAREVHADRYSYFDYINARIKVKIKCNICDNVFYQTSANHLTGHGCPMCKGKKTTELQKHTLTQFIEKAIVIHGHRFNYNNVVYIDSGTKVTLTCNICNTTFDQLPSNHLAGHSCPVCRYINNGNKSRLTLEEFIDRANKIHNYKYNYNKVLYLNGKSKIIVTCKDHGDFQQLASNHLNGHGCPVCKGVNVSIRQLLTIEQFIEKAKAIHGDKYDYSKVVYTGSLNKIIIICPIHGEFEQVPSGHLSGNGCPICKSSKGELVIKTILDKHNIQHVQEYRIPEVANILYYDFYLPDYKLLIEFHGNQHYDYIPFFHRNGEDDFLAQKNRDDIKKSNAIEFKYRLLEFNHKQLMELSKEEFQRLVLNKIKEWYVRRF